MIFVGMLSFFIIIFMCLDKGNLFIFFDRKMWKLGFMITFSIVGFMWILGAGLISEPVNTMKSTENHFVDLSNSGCFINS